MHRVKFNDYAELLSDDLNNNNAYLYNGLITTISDFIAANDCVSGLEVTAQAVPDMTVYVKSGRIYQNGYQGLLEADLTTPLTIAPASASQPRIDLICANMKKLKMNRKYAMCLLMLLVAMCRRLKLKHALQVQ